MSTMLMNIDQVVLAIRQAVAEVMKLPSADSIQEDTTLTSGSSEMDSIALADLISAIETRLGFQFSDSDLRPRSFSTVRTLANTVAVRLREGP